MTFFDTSVIVAAAQSGHPAYQACSSLLARATPANASCALHSLAETYSVLSGLPPPRRMPPDGVLLILKQMRERLRIVSLTEKDYAACIAALPAQGLIGGIVFDALLLQCARKCGATRIYTQNARHFRLIAPDLAARIVVP